MGDRRYALEPLCDALACSPDALKARLGLDRRQVAAYLERGLSEARADELAVKAGLPTHLVWPEMIDHAIMEISRECEAQGCEARFVLSHHARRFCSPRCRSREGNRRRYQNPEVAAVLRARVAAYRLENLRAKRLKDAMYRSRNRELLREKQRQRDQARRHPNIKDNRDRFKYEVEHKDDGKKTGEFSLVIASDSTVEAPFSPQSPQVRRETVAA